MAPLYRTGWRTLRKGSPEQDPTSPLFDPSITTASFTGPSKHTTSDRTRNAPSRPQRTTTSPKDGPSERISQDIPGVVHSIIKCPVCGGYLNLRISRECYHCGTRYLE